MPDAEMIVKIAKLLCRIDTEFGGSMWRRRNKEQRNEYIRNAKIVFLAIRPEIDRRVREARDAARNEALEDMAMAVDAIGSRLTAEWRAGGKANSYLEGKGDASDEYAESIRALKTQDDKPEQPE